MLFPAYKLLSYISCTLCTLLNRSLLSSLPLTISAVLFLSFRCLIKWLEVRKVCPLCNMPVLQLAQQAGSTDPPVQIEQPLPGIENLV